MKPTEQVLTIELLPKAGEFLIQLPNKEFVKGRFSMYALDRFCDIKGIASYQELLLKVTMQMRISEYAELVAFAIQDYYRNDYTQCPWNTDRVRDEIFEEAGGMGNDKLLSLFKHCVGRLSQVLPEEEATDDKKKVVKKKTK